MKKTAALLLALVVVACGARQRTRLGTEQTETEIAAPAPSVAQYTTTPPEGEAITGGMHAAEVRAGVEAGAQARSVALHGDPRLATLAEWISERLTPAGDPPPSEVIDFFAWNLGLTDPTPHVMVLGLPERADVASNVQSSTEQFLSRQTYTHWGATVVPRSGVWLIVVALSWRHLEIDPIDRTMPAGSPIRVHGRLAEGFSNPTVVAQSPGGETIRYPAGSGPEFDVRVPTEAAGAYRVELLARGAHGETVLLNAPVYAGTEPPRSVRLERAPETSGVQDVATVRAQLLEYLNRSRAEVGLSPLVEDPQLETIATAHTRDMIDHDFVGHTSPTTGSAADRVRTAGIQSGLVLENIGRGYSASEIHRGLLDSPGHRANLVNPHATHVGIGVIAEQENGRSAFLVTQVFIRVAEPIDTAAAPQALLAHLNRARTARSAPEMQIDPNLQQAAQEAAEAFFSEPSSTQQDTVDRASAALRRFGIQYSRIGGVMAVVTTLDEARQLEPALDETVRLCGIGVAQGTRPDTGPNAIAVVIVLGWER